jgi:hypothetical protein
LINYKKLSKIDISNVSFGFLLLEFITFFITKNYISQEVFIVHIIIILTLFILFIINLDLLNFKKKISNLNYSLFYLLILILLYGRKVNFSEHLNRSVNCKQINLVLLNFVDCSYAIFFNFLIFILVFLLFYLNKLKINLIKVFIYIGLIFIIISFYNLIIYYLINRVLINDNYLSGIFPFLGDYKLYFQFLPYAIPGKRNDEILIFALAFTSVFFSYLNYKRSILNYIIYLLFLSSFLTYSKNLWLSIFFIFFVMCYLFYQKKNTILKIFLKSLILLIITIIILSVIKYKIDKPIIEQKKEKYYVSLINYTLIKFNFKYDSNNAKVYFFKPTINEDNQKTSQQSTDFDPNYYFNSIPERALIYKTIINKFNLNNIFFGNGLNSIYFTAYKTINNSQFYIVNSESQILLILYEIGIIGLIFYLILLAKISTIISLEGKILFLTLLSLTFFNSYQENILFFFLVGAILGSSAKDKLEKGPIKKR